MWAVFVCAALLGPAQLVHAEGLGPGNPRLKIWAIDGAQSVRKTLVDYHCVPFEVDEEACKDGVQGPHRTGGEQLRVQRRGDVTIRTGIPAVAVDACIEGRAVVCLSRRLRGRPIGDGGRLWTIGLPRRFPPRTHRLTVFVRHPDGNGGSGEIALRVVRGRDRDTLTAPAPDDARSLKIVGGGSGPLFAVFTGGLAVNEVTATFDGSALGVTDPSGPIDARDGTSGCTGGGTPIMSCPNDGLAFAVWRLGVGDDELQAGASRCSEDYSLANLILGGVGDDRGLGGSREDGMRGGRGGDWLTGCGGIDALYGEAGPDTLVGGRQPDRLYGSQGADRLLGGSGRDILSGGSGDDFLDGGPGLNRIRCGRGLDVVSGEPRRRLPESCERSRP